MKKTNGKNLAISKYQKSIEVKQQNHTQKFAAKTAAELPPNSKPFERWIYLFRNLPNWCISRLQTLPNSEVNDGRKWPLVYKLTVG